MALKGVFQVPTAIEKKSCPAPDGVTIVYSAAGAGEPGLLFIHGGLADAERRMAGTSPAAAYALFLSMAGYDPAAAARRLTIPLRAIDGDLHPIDFAQVRKVKPDFDAVVMKHMGHYPMLERPAEFNHLLGAVIDKLLR